MSNQHSQFSQWRKQSKAEIIVCFDRIIFDFCIFPLFINVDLVIQINTQKSAKHNILARINKICNIIQQHPRIKHFRLSAQAAKSILSQINMRISSWRGVEHESCKKNKQSYKQYHKTAVNWFNRNKAKIFGTSLFYPLIFGHILNVKFYLNYHHIPYIHMFDVI